MQDNQLVNNINPNNRQKTRPVIYFPDVRTGINVIAVIMGVSQAKVREWIRDGAPIAVEKGSGKTMQYSTEIAALQQWRLEKSIADRKVSKDPYAESYVDKANRDPDSDTWEE